MSAIGKKREAPSVDTQMLEHMELERQLRLEKQRYTLLFRACKRLVGASTMEGVVVGIEEAMRYADGE